MAWKFYRYYWSSTGGYAVVPSNQWEWRRNAWTPMVANTAVDVSDAEGNVFIQYDCNSTDMARAVPGGTTEAINNASNIDINIRGAAVNMATTSEIGGRFDASGSSGNYYHSETAISTSGRGISSFSLTNAPPVIKLDADFNASGSSGHLTVFLSYKMNLS